MTRVLLLIDRARDREKLRKWLDAKHEVIAPIREEQPRALAEDPSFDMIFVGPVALRRHGAILDSVFEEESPVFLPLVLLINRVEAKQLPASMWQAVDEVITMPLLEQELSARVEALLRTRRLSLLAYTEMSQIFDSVDSAMCVVGVKRRVRRVNRAFAKLLGRRRDELRGLSAAEVLGTARLDAALEPVERVLSGAAAPEKKLELTTSDGLRRTFLLTTSAFRGLDGELTGAILELKDVTSLQQTTAELQEHRQQLEVAFNELKSVQNHLVRQERLHALGQMASGVVHDFNNTLSVILGYTEMLLHEKGAPLDDETKKSLEIILRAARDAAFIVKGLRGFYKSRSEDDPRELLSLNELLEEVITLTRPRWLEEASSRGGPIEIERDLGRIPRLMGNGAELREAVTNLVFNAVDAMPKGGRLCLSTRHNEGTAILTVHDTGVGMDDETMRHALEPFFTTKGDAGTGMGLAMVYGIVSRHQGVMSLESRRGVGTTVTLHLPLCAEERPVVEEASQRQLTVEPLRLLVVDDHPALRSSLAAQLRRDGHDVEVADDGIDGLDCFNDGDFDVVITDRAMPNLDGERFAAVLKATSPKTPIIMLSGSDDNVGARRKPANIDIMLEKPVPINELRRALLAVTPASMARRPDEG